MRTWNRSARVGLVAALFCWSASHASAELGKMVYYEGFDLETGTVHPEPPFGYPAEVDFWFAYNANTIPHARLFQNYPAEVAFLDETTFESVCAADLPALELTMNLIDEPLEYDDTIVIKTPLGNFYKIGHAEEMAGFVVHFEYEKLVFCSGDIDCDGSVGQGDLGALLAAFGTCEGEPGYNPRANLAQGPTCPAGAAESINQADLGALLAVYGDVCP